MAFTWPCLQVKSLGRYATCTNCFSTMTQRKRLNVGKELHSEDLRTNSGPLLLLLDLLLLFVQIIASSVLKFIRGFSRNFLRHLRDKLLAGGGTYTGDGSESNHSSPATLPHHPSPSSSVAPSPYANKTPASMSQKAVAAGGGGASTGSSSSSSSSSSTVASGSNTGSTSSSASNKESTASSKTGKGPENDEFSSLFGTPLKKVCRGEGLRALEFFLFEIMRGRAGHLFLVADTQLFKRLCPSVRPSVRP